MFDEILANAKECNGTIIQKLENYMINFSGYIELCIFIYCKICKLFLYNSKTAINASSIAIPNELFAQVLISYFSTFARESAVNNNCPNSNSCPSVNKGNFQSKFIG